MSYRYDEMAYPFDQEPDPAADYVAIGRDKRASGVSEDDLIAAASKPVPSADYERGEPEVEGARIGPMMGSEETYRRALIAAYGRCTCETGFCDAEGEPGCGFCQHLDPEWPCPHDPEDGWPKHPVAGGTT